MLWFQVWQLQYKFRRLECVGNKLPTLHNYQRVGWAECNEAQQLIHNVGLRCAQHQPTAEVLLCFFLLLLGPLAVYRTARATQGELHRDVQFSFDRTGNSA
jgi:hypothetical protein